MFVVEESVMNHPGVTISFNKKINAGMKHWIQFSEHQGMSLKCLVSCRGGVLQKKIGNGCAAGNFDYHPIAKPQTDQICNSYSNQIFCFTLWSINSSTLFNRFRKLMVKNEKGIRYLNHFFQKKKKLRGDCKNLRGKKGYCSQMHIHVPTFPLSTPSPVS